MRVILVFLLGLLLASGCAPVPTTAPNPGSPTIDLAHIVQATLAAMTLQAPAQPTPSAPTATPTESNAGGSISGSLTYPADMLPPLFVVAYQVDGQNHYYVTTHSGQNTYEIDNVPPGTYHVIAYTVGGGGFPFGLAGGYTKAVPCGLATECADHSLIDVPVAASKHVTGISPGDWYAPAGTFPPFPEAAALSTAIAGSATAPAASPTP